VNSVASNAAPNGGGKRAKDAKCAKEKIFKTQRIN